MPEIFEFPNASDTGSLTEFSKYGNAVTDGIFIPIFVWVVFIVAFISTKNFRTSQAFTLASFISMMIAIPFAVLNLLSPNFMYIFIIFTGIGLVWLKLQTGRIA